MIAFVTMFFEWIVGEHKKPGSQWNTWVGSPDEESSGDPADGNPVEGDDCTICGEGQYEQRSSLFLGTITLRCNQCGEDPYA